MTAADMLTGTGLLPGVAILYRIETILADQHVDAVFTTIVGNSITIKTGALGLLLTLDSTSYPVNFATMYVGSRSLRTDLTSVHTLDSTADILGTIGRIDERNPLAVAAQVAFGNTSTPIQVFGVNADAYAGHTDARDKMSNRTDIYAIVPLMDDITAANWVSILAMWKAHAVAFAAAAKSNFRIIVGSYADLPTTKSVLAPAADASTSAAVAALVDVFVDPDTNVHFLQDEVAAGQLLDVSHQFGATTLETVNTGRTIFNGVGAPYLGAKVLYGAMGEKRLRTTTAVAAVSGVTVDYAVRDPILLSEGGTPVLTISDLTWTTAGGVDNHLTKPGAVRPFDGVAVGDVVKGVNTASHEYGMLVTAIDAAAAAYIDVSTRDADANSGTLDLEIYRPMLSSSMGAISATNKFTAAAPGSIVGVVPGDIVYMFHTNALVPGNANVGMWIVQAATSNDIVVYTDAAHLLTNDGGGGIGVGVSCLAIYHPTAGRGVASVTTRKRLSLLTDLGQSFISTVSAGNFIEIPYPADVNPTHFDTTTTMWPVQTIVTNEILEAQLTDLQELAPKAFIAGYNLDCPYRISIALDKTGQVVELNTITTSLKSSRILMTWPNACEVTDVVNELTGVAGVHKGQYLACTVGGMIAGLPSHQGFTFISVAGISSITNSNFYFSDDQIDDLSEGGWYVFLQDSETAAPYCAHEVTTDTDTYELGELMFVKNFDFVSLFYKRILGCFIGRYNIFTETLSTIRGSLNAGTDFLRLRSFPKIGAPLISATVTLVEQLPSEVDRVEVYMLVDLPKVLNKIGLHLIA
jgi:hypothetical protein